MPKEIGKVYLTRSALASIASFAATECYGVVGMANKTPRDLLSLLFRRENLSKGVGVKITSTGIHLVIYVILELGVRISEVVRIIRDQVTFRISAMSHLDNIQIDIVVCNVRAHDA